MIKRVCDMCKKEVELKDFFDLALVELNDQNQQGNYVYCGEICKKCGKSVLKLFKNKIDISQTYKKEFKQN